MISLERVSSFVKSYIKDDEGELGEIYRKAVDESVPIMRPETKEFLKTQLLIKKPISILEIGTAVGYSSLFMSQFVSKQARITTIELDESRADIAETNIQSMNKTKVITVLRGDAAKVLKTLNDDFYDFVFVDAAKGQYINYFEDVLRVTKRDGLIISDNILQNGEIIESHFVVEKRNRTIHDRMREYVYALFNDDRVESAVLTVADGIGVTVKK